MPLGTLADSPVLVQLPQRAWGAAANLTADAVKTALGRRVAWTVEHGDGDATVTVTSNVSM